MLRAIYSLRQSACCVSLLTTAYSKPTETGSVPGHNPRKNGGHPGPDIRLRARISLPATKPPSSLVLSHLKLTRQVCGQPPAADRTDSLLSFQNNFAGKFNRTTSAIYPSSPSDSAPANRSDIRQRQSVESAAQSVGAEKNSSMTC